MRANTTSRAIMLILLPNTCARKPSCPIVFRCVKWSVVVGRSLGTTSLQPRAPKENN